MITIYGLRDPRNNETRYVGKTRLTLRERLRAHINTARSGLHRHCYYWIRELLAIDLVPIIFAIEQVEDNDTANIREQHWIATLPNLTNLREGGDKGKLSAETRQKMSAAHKGKTINQETRQKMAKAATGRILDKETRRKLSDSRIGNKNSLGRIVSTETRQKIAEKAIGRGHSQETRQKISTLGKGRKRSEEAKARTAAAHRGSKRSEEARLRMSEAQKRRYQKEDP